MITTLAAWLHDLDPFALELPDVALLPDGIRWYGLSYLVGFFVGYLLVRRVTRVGVSTLRPDLAADYIVTVAIGIVLGGRLGYCLLYQPSLFTKVYDHLPFWGPLAINEGGMASHGGILGGVLGAWWYAWRHKHDLPFLLDLFAFGAPLGLFFGRIANFINGELFGRGPTEVPWAVKFPQELYDEPELAGRVLEATGLRSVDHVIHAIQNHNGEVARVVEPLLTPRHPSQLYAAVAEGLVVFLVLLFAWRVPRRPGLVGSWFALTYGVMRIIDEFFRRPDQHIADQEFATLGITRGQWLSILVVAVGLWGLWYSRYRAQKHGIQPMGSWRRGPWTSEPTPAPAA